ncbi:Cof-type HAD-IIB family hydrolase [Eremococcus coleocola]|uniref:Cof-like hydrolase n=1 Tax=Eremococcus coleocola ACS-139-V-Col8 TaxID=908337 RepID=E4KNV9_9LACT|nr:Cof-type HAD-IIB family hydrolase [Eremococcus coleocola]EFR31313.1 Cof-like hydrolase [Eremococcus coleocola ACS-139-V-Col8]
MIKLIAIDLDGTLVNDQKEIPLENIKAIHRAQAAGVRVVLCTGRPYTAVKPLVDQLGFTDHDLVAVFNGGQIRKAVSGQVLSEKTISQADMLRWYAETERLQIPFNIIDSDWVYEPASYPEGHPSFYVGKVSSAPATHADFNQFAADHRFNKLVVTVEADYLEQQLGQMDPDLMAEFSLSRSYPFQLEIMAQGIDKGYALDQLSQVLNIDIADMVAIGDQLNDLAMIEKAGHGVAMGNAEPEIKALAEYITDTNNNAGVAKAIDYYLQKEKE